MIKLSKSLLTAGFGSLALSVTPGQAQVHTAFIVPAGQAGNQRYGGSLGHEFNVVSNITVTKLGCFDDLSNGLSLPIKVQLFDRTDPAKPIYEMNFPVDDPATPQREDGELIGGSRFLALPTPLNLPAGFQGMISASGYGNAERDGNSASPAWTRDDAGGLLSFNGLVSRYGVANTYPETADKTNAYAAATFQYQANGAAPPGSPTVVLAAGNGQMQLTWTAVTLPVSAAKYRIQRAVDLTGPFSQIAETTALTYTDTGLTNGTTYFYKVSAVAADGTESADGAIYRDTPYQLGPDRHIAYFDPANLVGSAGNPGYVRGMDFDVQNPVIITRLGVFDDGSNGIQPDPGPDGLPGTEDDIPRVLTSILFNRDDQTVTASLEFSTADPGTLIGGMRFKNLPSPVPLPLGFKGCIAVDGYGTGELPINSGGNAANVVWTLDDGNDSLLFTGSSRYNASPGINYPDVVSGNLVAAYASGTFEFQTTAGVAPGKPSARLSIAVEDSAATLAWDAVTVPAPAVKYNIYRNDGTPEDLVYTFVGTVTSGLTYRVTGLTNGQSYSFVVRAVSANNTESLVSNTVTAIPAPRAPGVAYVVPEGTVGNQNFGGILGMEFDVIHPIRITRLGAFDSGGDGLARPITVRIYDRTNTAAPVVSLTFPVDDPATPLREDGELIDGSRFLNPPQSLVLPAGFQGTVTASGYGASELLGNRNPHPWTTYNGGSLLFTGHSRYGMNFDVYPDVTSLDGPVNSFAAGTFQFEVNDAPLPFAPAPVLTGGNGQVQLSWPAVSQEIPAVSYRIFRSVSSSGPFTQAGSVTGTTYTDTGLTNGTTYFYKMVAVGGGDVLSRESAPLACAPYQLLAGRHIAYFTPGDLKGNTANSASQGMDFDVQNSVILTRLGIFDAQSDGIQPDPGADGIAGTGDDVPRTINVSLYDRDSGTAKATLSFTTAAPGTLVAGMRFKDLAAPLTLPAGFHGCIVTDGYGPGEPVLSARGVENNAVWTLDDGSQSLVFTGTSRSSGSTGVFPEIVDSGLADNYAAGTFEYQTTAATAPGQPVVRLGKALEDGAATLAWDAVTTPAPAAKYRVYQYNVAGGIYTLLGETVNLGYRITGLTNGVPVSFVVRAVSSGGQEGLASTTISSTPEAPAAGVAYVVPEGTIGTQVAFPGSLGMDFDVMKAVQVTRLGAFDSGADGLQRPITVSLYDRNKSGTALATILFPVDDPATPVREDGELIESSRFLTLAQPLLLPPGFQGTIAASGYGNNEPNGNAAAGAWTTFNGGSLLFVGTSRYGNAGIWPSTPDSTVNRYAAGTFYFEPASLISTFDANLTITPLADNQVSLNWTATPGAILQRSTDMKAGNWISVPTAVPGFRTIVTGREFFRLIKP